jgi:predicted DNA-binding transcriptional regulator AlpA
MSAYGKLPETGYIRLKTVLAVYPVSRATWYAGISAGKFPAPVKLSKHVAAWRVEDIRALLKNAGERK